MHAPNGIRVCMIDTRMVTHVLKINLVCLKDPRLAIS